MTTTRTSRAESRVPVFVRARGPARRSCFEGRLAATLGAEMENEVVVNEPEMEMPAPEPRPSAPPIRSRFLFVDVAALRAKQLRRGARPRLDQPVDVKEGQPKKAERIAMEEVRRGFVLYDVPDRNAPPADETAVPADADARPVPVGQGQDQ